MLGNTGPLVLSRLPLPTSQQPLQAAPQRLALPQTPHRTLVQEEVLGRLAQARPWLQLGMLDSLARLPRRQPQTQLNSEVSGWLISSSSHSSSRLRSSKSYEFSYLSLPCELL